MTDVAEERRLRSIEFGESMQALALLLRRDGVGDVLRHTGGEQGLEPDVRGALREQRAQTKRRETQRPSACRGRDRHDGGASRTRRAVGEWNHTCLAGCVIEQPRAVFARRTSAGANALPVRDIGGGNQ